MQTLISAINDHLNPAALFLYNQEKVEAVVKAHQSQYPSNWQNWEEVEMATYMANGLNRAAEKGETGAARILQEGF